MAKRRRKARKSIGESLKYEIYGILLITLSVIALSGEAAVGRSLSKLFGLLLGKYYFVIALVGVYVGLTVMVKRAWPKGWSSRKTGILVLILGLTLWSSIAEIDRKFDPVDSAVEMTASSILHQLGSDLQGQLLSPEAPSGSVMSRDIAGGYAGAVQYTILYALFGVYGTKFLLLVMFAISIMLITGKSYIDILQGARKRIGRLIILLRAKYANRRPRTVAVSAARAAGQGAGTPLARRSIDDFDDDADEDDDDGTSPASNRRSSLLFPWMRNRQQPAEQHTAEPREWTMDHDDEQEEAPPQRQPRTPVVRIHSDRDRSSDSADEQQQHAEERPSESILSRMLRRAGSPDTRVPQQAESASEQGYHEADETPPWAQEHNEFEENAEDDTPFDMPEGYSQQRVAPSSLSPAFEDGQDEHNGQGGQYDDAEIDEDSVDHHVHYDQEEMHQPEIHESEALQSESGDSAATDSVPHSVVPKAKPYKLPSLSLLAKPAGGGKGSDGVDRLESQRKLEATLESFGVRAKVLDVVQGPAVTRYEVQPATGVKVSRIVGLQDDIALALAAKDIRMEAPIPGKSAIGIEVPNSEVSVVTMREVMESNAFQNAGSKLSIAFGRDISGQSIVGNLAKMPHLLVAGATGSGKSVCINGIITSILYKAKPDEVKFMMIDPKMVELNMYNGIPHLLAPVVTDPRRASLALKKIVVEMEKRYELFSKSGTRNIEGYNNLMESNPAAVLPYIVVIVDELADLMMVAANDVEDAITRLAQMARAAGIHLIIATQRPSVDVITGVIKANIPSRIAFGVSSQVDSRTILDMAGAEKLLGRGDMLFLPVGMSKPIRVQGAFLSDPEVESIVEHCRSQGEAEYKPELVPEIDDSGNGQDEEILDELFDQAVGIVVDAKQASVSLLQRRMRVGYTRAARLIDQMEAKGVVGPYEGSKPREVLWTPDHANARTSGQQN
ncbi:S-DNA-T family DNA segregation ATPase FtsK/SpoIIIE [Paenibacillus cellulosilyticus]|uniref:S-DNA-T family DNA segregation ATPase FtsK/SpoIIIE n=1 Tax=Paenibacillus cellulosilyticus TaxID=375489 RepID=A0A2V2YXH8_9BACL|nr:DNA translocase FtsK [Paenibacillus cellulosilyticus]PWW06457.1 S-DNA-T family DNA segregation ATPase FtsK/SpoIIIE [Paenibacillus cellulosilyticus]QKS46198.1 DNA translocase FtsK [Paenibacillus cellulosilyticus]